MGAGWPTGATIRFMPQIMNTRVIVVAIALGVVSGDLLPPAATWTKDFLSAEEVAGLLESMATPAAAATARQIDDMRVTSDVSVSSAVAKRLLTKFELESVGALVLPASVIVGGDGNETDEHVDHRLQQDPGSGDYPNARGTAFVVLQAPPNSTFSAGGIGVQNVSVPYTVGMLVEFSEGVAHSSTLPSYQDDSDARKLKLLGPFDITTFERVGGDPNEWVMGPMPTSSPSMYDSSSSSSSSSYDSSRPTSSPSMYDSSSMPMPAKDCSYRAVIEACKQVRGAWGWTCEKQGCNGADYCGPGTKFDGNVCVPEALVPSP